MTIFSEKCSVFTPKNYDDLFLVIDEVFRFSLSFSRFSVSLLCSMSRYITLSSQENHNSRKEFLDDTFFLLCSYFRAHPTTLLLKNIGEGRMHGSSPTSNFWGDRPPSPPKVSAPGCSLSNAIEYIPRTSRCCNCCLTALWD